MDEHTDKGNQYTYDGRTDRQGQSKYLPRMYKQSRAINIPTIDKQTDKGNQYTYDGRTDRQGKQYTYDGRINRQEQSI